MGHRNPQGAAGRSGVIVHLLHGFELSVSERRVALPATASRVVAFLALHRRRLKRDFVAGKLWTESSEERAHSNLRSALWKVRTSGFPVVEADRTSIRLAPDVDVDVTAVVDQCQHLIDDSLTPSEAHLDAAPLRWELLPDWYEEWVFFERERLRQLCLHALEALADRLSAVGRHAEAVDAGLAAVQFERLRESAWRALIRAHLAEANRSEAIRQYRYYRRLLHEELGLQPSAELEALMDRTRTAPPAPAAGGVRRDYFGDWSS